MEDTKGSKREGKEWGLGLQCPYPCCHCWPDCMCTLVRWGMKGKGDGGMRGTGDGWGNGRGVELKVRRDRAIPTALPPLPAWRPVHLGGMGAGGMWGGGLWRI